MSSLLYGTRRALFESIGRHYYVDATLGNDANDGQSPGTPWQTIAKVNASAFNPGDNVLFKRGETWVGTTLAISSDGTPGHPIKFSDYGSGALPIIDGNDAANCVVGGGQAHIHFENIEVTQGLDFGFHFNNASYIDLINCVAHDCGNDNIIFINLTHHCTAIGCTSYDPYERVIGPRISCLEVADEAHDIYISDCECYGSVSAGITIHSHAATEFPYNVTVSSCNSHDNDEFGIIVTQDNAGAAPPADAKIHVTNCTFPDNAGGAGTGAGIWITKTADTYPAGIVFDQCTSFSASDRPVYIGGQATFTRCAFRASTAAQVDGVDAQSVIFTNCTFYRTGGPTFETNNTPDDCTMRNCIVAGASTIYNIRAGTTNTDIDYTLYFSFGFDIMTVAIMGWLGVFFDYPDWLTNSGMDGNSPTPDDPLFTNAAANDFTLQAASPARGAGIELGFGTDLGAFQYGA